MRSGVKAKDVVVGTGDEALRSKAVVVNVRTFLNHGTEITSTFGCGPRIRIDLSKRDCIAGLRYGIEGMRVGGRRQLTIGPHLAYGAGGVPGHVPPDAVLRCDVELLEVRERGVSKPEDYPPGKHLYVFHPGEAARRLARWQFGLEEDGRCGATVTHPIPGMPWRHTLYSQVQAHWDAAATQAVFDSAFGLPKESPTECLGQTELWADHAERGNAITRSSRDNALCLTIGVMERGQWLCYYSIAEASPVLLSSRLFLVVNGLMKEHLATAKGRPLAALVSGQSVAG